MEDSITDSYSPRQVARMLADDIRELESMSEADKNRYAAPLPTYNFIKR